MTPEQFAYWLQGFAEVSDRSPNVHEWKIIKDHLATVFKKVTPTYPPGVPIPREPYIGPTPINPIGPYVAPNTQPYTMPPNYPRPEVICSAGTNLSSGDAAYSFFTTSTQEKNKKLNESLK